MSPHVCHAKVEREDIRPSRCSLDQGLRLCSEFRLLYGTLIPRQHGLEDAITFRSPKAIRVSSLSSKALRQLLEDVGGAIGMWA